MGDVLKSYFEFIKKEGGMNAAMRLAVKTSMTSVTAASTPDSPDLINKFRTAIFEILGKYPPK